jgi:hypothetical protein
MSNEIQAVIKELPIRIAQELMESRLNSTKLLREELTQMYLKVFHKVERKRILSNIF